MSGRPAAGAFLFDLDGTLVDSVPGIAWSMNRALSEAGHAPLSLDEVRGLIGRNADEIVTHALSRTGGTPDPEEVKRVTSSFLQTYSENPAKDTVLFPGAIGVLERLAGEGAPMAICTNKPRKTTMPVLDVFDLGRFFPVIRCGDDVPHRKPDGRHIYMTLDDMNRTANDAVMVGDSENDILAAHDAGVPSICVTFGYSRVPFEELKPTALIGSFAEFFDAVDAIRKGKTS